MDLRDIPVVNDAQIPKGDVLVREELKRLGQPVFVNGEGETERRERLMRFKRVGEKGGEKEGKQDEVDEEGEGEEDEGGGEGEGEEGEDDDDEQYYTPGLQELYNVRLEILQSSLNKASSRLQLQRQFVRDNFEFTTILQKRRAINSNLSQIELQGSQVIPENTRAISSVKFSNNMDLIACGSWDGSIHVLSSTDLNPVAKLALCHLEKVASLDWKPASSENLLISGGNEGTINLWDIVADKTLTPSALIKGAHTDRITSVKFHPLNNLAISTSFDQTWKLWDIARQVELYQQEGHSKGVFSGAIHPDGSLFLSGGLDGIIYVWDLRSGRSLMPLQKHMQGVYGLDWSPNGYEFASGSGDCSVKIWDMRKLDRSGDELYTIPAHTKLVSDVRFFRDYNSAANGSFLISSSYDGCVNVWSADSWIKVNSLNGHTDKVMSCDVGCIDDKVTVVSSGWDRSVKLWSYL